LSGRTPQGVAADLLTGPLPYARDALNVIPGPGGKTIRGYKPDSLLNALVFPFTGVSLPNPPPGPGPTPTPAAASGAYLPGINP
jgi:hypothetical protein